MKFEYYCIELDSKDDNGEINKELWNITKKGDELINVSIHPTRKTIMFFIKSPHPSKD
jgi:hypothetical protein